MKTRLAIEHVDGGIDFLAMDEQQLPIFSIARARARSCDNP